MSERTYKLQVDDSQLEGDLRVPAGATGLVLFAHGSGSSRHSPRNVEVAEFLQSAGLATFLVDLLTMAEDALDRQTRQYRFDVPMLGRRLGKIIDWLATLGPASELPLGLYGASTGAAASLIAAANRARRVGAVVSRGGRPDLASSSLRHVQAPTLLIVGSADEDVLELNRHALESFRPATEVRLSVIPGAGHLFEEPGSLEEVSRESAAWFQEHLQEHRLGLHPFEELDSR
ncbi:MAG TPA: alpha/beta family hydrolase [Pirellulales bacterium]|jgi:pimeloyl-ACP methyl ester carboxylesterase|nr:alpha/beta family hydrolase [Pirellulales bacterium]